MENSNKHLHVISFAIPYPATYGGVIDVFYKIKALAEQGVKIHLHNFTYGDREPHHELEKHCASVHYYERKTGIKSAVSIKPYIVKSRKSEELIQNLLKDDYPILFEGLHSCAIINDPRLKNRHKVYREANIEHHYYYSLFKADSNVGNKIYFLVESFRLFLFQKVLESADQMIVVSDADKQYLEEKFPHKKVEFIPCFHSNKEPDVKAGKGEYALYNGNLSVPENIKAATYLIEKVFSKSKHPFIITGKNPPAPLQNLCDKYPHIQLIANPDDKKMEELIREAHVHILVTFQGTGLKLKLLNTLYKGRFNLVNSTMLTGSGLEKACIIADNPLDQRKKLNELFERDFTETDVLERKKHINERYCNMHNARKVIDLIFSENN